MTNNLLLLNGVLPRFWNFLTIPEKRASIRLHSTILFPMTAYNRYLSNKSTSYKREMKKLVQEKKAKRKKRQQRKSTLWTSPKFVE